MAAKVRVDYVRAPSGAQSDRVDEVFGGGETITVTSPTSAQSSAAPPFTAINGARTGNVYARVQCLAGAVSISAPGANPVATEAGGTRLDINQQPILVAIATGQKLAFYEASDAPASTGGGGGGGSGGGGPATATAVSDGKTNLPAATAVDVFAASGTASVKTFRNRGPNDATYVIGADATGAATERTLYAGEEKTLNYKYGSRISFFSTLGTDIEWEFWS